MKKGRRKKNKMFILKLMKNLLLENFSILVGGCKKKIKNLTTAKSKEARNIKRKEECDGYKLFQSEFKMACVCVCGRGLRLRGKRMEKSQ